MLGLSFPLLDSSLPGNLQAFGLVPTTRTFGSAPSDLAVAAAALLIGLVAVLLWATLRRMP